MTSIFDDTSFDERARPIIAAAHRDAPSDEALKQAALVEYDPSPAMIEHTARWIDIREALTRDGLAPGQILRVYVRALAHAYNVWGPGTEVTARMFADAADTAAARDVCEHLITRDGTHSDLKGAGTIAMAHLATAAEGELDPRFDELFEWFPAPMTVVRSLLAALTPERREALVLSKSVPLAGNAGNAAFLLDKLLSVRDLVDTPAVAAARASLIAAAAGDDRLPALEAEEAAGTPRPVHARPTPQAQQALQYWLNLRAAERRAGELGPLAEQVWSERTVSVDAPELASVSAWAAADDGRQREIAEAVAAALGPDFSLVGLERFGGPPIAVLSLDGERFCLVPGGTVEMGLSSEEEAGIREAAERNAGCGNHYELYGSLFDQLEVMRPLTRVAVGPMVVAQEPGFTLEPRAATDELERSPLRLPSEAEWEYLARGGPSRELTYRGTDVPDNEEWFGTTAKLGTAGANAFGLWGFGFEPETCADVYHPGHDGLPTDGSPRRGEGPRVVKGGAAQIYPWQACGEWQLLLSAMRTAQTAWEYGIALRFVIGITIASQ